MNMERINCCCSYQFKDQIIDYYTLFGYNFEGIKNLHFSRIKLSFSREDANKKVREVEGKYRLYPFLTFYPVAIACLLILVLATLFLIFTFKGGGDKLTYFLSFMLPAFILLPLIAVYTYVRYHFDSKNILILSSLKEIKKQLEE